MKVDNILQLLHCISYFNLVILLPDKNQFELKNRKKNSKETLVTDGSSAPNPIDSRKRNQPYGETDTSRQLPFPFPFARSQQTPSRQLKKSKNQITDFFNRRQKQSQGSPFFGSTKLGLYSKLRKPVKRRKINPLGTNIDDNASDRKFPKNPSRGGKRIQSLSQPKRPSLALNYPLHKVPGRLPQRRPSVGIQSGSLPRGFTSPRIPGQFPTSRKNIRRFPSPFSRKRSGRPIIPVGPKGLLTNARAGLRLPPFKVRPGLHGSNSLRGLRGRTFFQQADSKPNTPARKAGDLKPKNAGPNRCKGGQVCCAGWTINIVTRLCTVPTCRSPCGFGICRSPNLCQCMDGGFGSFCKNPKGAGSGCPQACLNGAVCQGTVCVCRTGYVGTRCEQPICKQACLNNGRCIGPDRCACPYGYTGKRCELDHRLGPCFTKIEKNMCRNQLHGVKCSRDSCCSTVGAAWGVPCQRCPARRECARGLHKDPKTGKCVDINECRGIPNICAMGTCVNTVGSYRCECGAGRIYNPVKFECSDWDECKSGQRVCEFGKCINLDGSYRCECNEGMELTDGGKRCTEPQIPGKCYVSFAEGCVNAAKRLISKKECCCENPERAHTYCKKCPVKGTRDYRKLGCGPLIPPVPPKPKFCDPVACTNGECQDNQCVCNKNYFMKNGKCIILVSDTCAKTKECTNGVCNKADGKDFCECDDGFTVNGEGNCIKPGDDECDKGDNCYQGTCDTKDGVKFCQCNDGFIKSVKGICVVDEELQKCDKSCKNGKCATVDGKKVCLCNEGFHENEGVCVKDRDSKEQCEIFGTCENGNCVKTDSGTNCVCKAGFEKNDDNNCVETPVCSASTCINGNCFNNKCICGDASKLVDGVCVKQGSTDRCKEEKVCNNGKCVIRNEAPDCLCDQGYGKDSDDICRLKEDTSCKETDSCENGVCATQNGKQICVCNVGFTRTDDDTCVRKEDKLCASTGMCVNGECTQVNGIVTCLCKEGFVKNLFGICDVPNADAQCERGVCANGVCETRNGKKTCTCNEGFVKDEHGQCVEIADKACASGTTCLNGVCKTRGGEPICVCNQGFAKSPQGLCKEKGDAVCAKHGVCPNGICQSIDGKKTCVCNDGYVSKEGFCILKADEKCKLSGSCDNGKCRKINGERKCFCDDGFKMNAKNVCVKEKCDQGKTKDIDGFCVDIKDKVCITGGECGNGYCDNGVCTCYDGYAKDAEGVCVRPVPKLCDGLFNRCENGECKEINGNQKCECKEGFETGNDNQCIDFDECYDGDEVCTGGFCSNEAGGFKCDCAKGFVLSANGTCQDANECEGNPCPNGECKNLYGTFQCLCNKGYQTGEGNTCIDLDECSEYVDVCPGNQVCENTDGSFVCNCASGYTSENDQCVDMDECALDEEICGNGECFNTEGTYKCTCNSGYVASVDGTACLDMDECADIEGVCEGGKCVNSPGSYKCECGEGFLLSSTGTDCVDQQLGNCYTGYNPLTKDCTLPTMKQLRKADCCCGTESCIKQRAWGEPCSGCPGKGSPEFQELCPQGCGYVGGKNVNECLNNMGTTSGICPNGRCIDKDPGYECKCLRGFQNAEGSDKICEDIDECIAQDKCKGGTCTNTVGGFMCKCPDGYELDAASNCIDMDECLDDPCTGGICTNTDGSYTCSCPEGSKLEENLCRDIRIEGCFLAKVDDACTKPISAHTSLSECCNSGIGKFWGDDCLPCPNDPTLGCTTGYKRMGKECVDINECLLDGICTEGECVNTEGGFKCVCAAGWELDLEGRTCVDMRNGTCYGKASCQMPLGAVMKKSECCCARMKAWSADKACEVCPAESSNEFNELCPQPGYVEGKDINECSPQYGGICKNGLCKNTNGSFACECDTGFGVDDTGTMCLDYDECIITKDICGPGECMNTHGSFRCKCHNGYRNANMMEMCVDINECLEMKPSPCQRGQCVNTPGSFKCDCPEGFKTMGAAIACEDVDECEDPTICTNGVCQNFLGSYHCACNDGYRPGPNMKKCYDIDECNLNNGGCEYDCTNTDGSFKCVCQEGFELRADTKTCKDIDECERGTPCGEGNQCTNTIGGYVCICSIGYRLSNDARACIDVDECQGLTCHNGDCKNTVGSFECTCREGYRLEPNAMACIDIDECKIKPDKCHKDARCINKVGSYECQCKPGYSGTGKECEDQDECAFGMANCALDSQCVNTIGSFGCECKPGYSGDGEVCIDINECALNESTCQPGVCMNTNGAFKCDCPDGYKPTQDAKGCIDLDECTEREGTCQHGFCQNNIGNFECSCENGFEPDGTKTACIDIDECQTANRCLYGKCENTVGGFKCVCNETEGFLPNPTETACIDIRKGMCLTIAEDTKDCVGIRLSGEQMLKQMCCCTARQGAGWLESTNEKMEACPNIGTEQYEQLCPGGPSTHVDGNTGKIIKHDGCEVLPNYCKNGACSNNAVGGISCQCPQGYKFNSCSQSCVDINECETDSICGYRSRCINADKSYVCECPEGYSFNKEENFCRDERPYQCYMSARNEDGCETPLPSNVTIGKCCCSQGMQGNKYSDQCINCPTRGTGEYKALCIGKPALPKVPTGQEATVIPTKPPATDIDGNIVPTDKAGVTLYPTDQSAPTDEKGNTIFATVKPSAKVTKPHVLITDETGKVIGAIPTDKEGRTLYPPGKPPTDENGNTIYATYTAPKPTKPPVFITDEDGNKIGIIPTDKEGVTLYPPGKPPTDKDGNTIFATYAPPKTTKPPVLITNEKGEIIGVVPTDEKGKTLYPVDKPPPTDESGNTIYPTYKPPADKDNIVHGIVDLQTTIDPNNAMDMCKILNEPCKKGKCINTVNGYNCDCDEGYVETRIGGSPTCIDNDECFEDPCEDGQCTNTEGSFICECNATMTLAPGNPTKCIDLDECSTPGYCENGDCINLPDGQGFICKCKDGFMATMDGNSCKDINECLMDSICGAGNCVNTNGSHVCECHVGYELNAVGKCEDMDECEAEEDPCVDGICSNNEGSYVCKCEEGFIEGPDSASCLDFDECSDSTFCENGHCVNTRGSATCTCDIGYKATENGRSCEDRDECAEHENICPHGSCQNLEGSWQCICDEGFQATSNNRTCEDINECDDETFCQNGQCLNTVGSAVCSCNDGFNLTGEGFCEDLDECSEIPTPCRFGGTSCINTAGSYTCVCKEGFVFDSAKKDCVDTRLGFCYSSLDETDGLCAESNGKLVTKSHCCCSMNVGWGPACELCPDSKTEEFKYHCPKGSGYDKATIDINECEHNLGKCTNGVCKNTDGSYMCQCNDGFKSDTDTTCIDLDECKELDDACGPGGESCVNTIGSFQCTCKIGYKPGEKSPACVDIDECSTGEHRCAFRCKNTMGSYRCACPRGFKVAENGIHCQDVNECAEPGKCPFLCKNLVGSFMCLCPEGYTRDPKTGSCKDIDECSAPGGDSLCKPGGVCENVQGTYRCNCVAPHMKSEDEKHCFDKSMKLCFSNIVDGNCEVSTSRKFEKVSQAACCCTMDTNAWGTDCSVCPAKGSERRKALCKDAKPAPINECEFMMGICKNGKCMDTPTSFRCMCNDGFKLTMNGQACVDIDECAEGTSTCPTGCKNTIGSFECQCPKGYVINKDKTKCIDEDECETGNHNCPNLCVNTEGSFKCTCPKGYRLLRNVCTNINECINDPNICGLGHCEDVEGSYRCNCARGLQYDSDKKSCVYITHEPTKKPPTEDEQGCNPQFGCGCPQGFFPYYNPFGQSQCVDVNECRQGLCGQSSCINTLGSFQCSCPPGFNFKNGQCEDLNECNRSPCQFGCQNNRGGFACQCPAGFYPVEGGHCVATHGVHCVSCDTSDIPSEGVPLADAEETITAQETAAQHEAFQSPIDTDIAEPLEDETRKDLQTSRFSYYPEHLQQQHGQYEQHYGQSQFQTHQSGYQQSEHYPNYNQGFNPYQETHYDPYMYGYANRKRRSLASKKHKPIRILMSRNAGTNTTLMKMVPLLKNLPGHMIYDMKYGNSTLFNFNTSNPGQFYLQTTEKMTPGKYIVGISGEYNNEIEELTKLERLEGQIYNELRLDLKIVISVL